LIATVLFFFNRQNSPVPLLLWGVVGFIAGIVLFVYGFKLLQRRRLILDTPFSKIRSASMGMVEICGQAVGPYTLVAPITARPCYYYRTNVYELQQRGKNKQWVKVATECMFVPFFVDDNTGRMLVDPRGADLDLHRDFQQEFSNSFFTTLDPAPGNVISFLARRGVSTQNKLKVEEFCIKPKNALFILGTLAENHSLEVAATPVEDFLSTQASSTGLSLSMNLSFSSSSVDNDIDHAKFTHYIEQKSSTSTQQVIRLSPEHAPEKVADMTQQQKIAAALMKAGISSPTTWSAAGALTPQSQILTAATAHSENDNGSNGSNRSNYSSSHQSTTPDPNNPLGEFILHPPVVLKKGSTNKNFLISWRSQQEVARSLGWKCALMIWGGPVLALLGLYIVLRGAKLL
jgi:hypothetical protein